MSITSGSSSSPGQPLLLDDYDRLHFQIWSPNITALSVKVRDYGPNLVWDAAGDDVEFAKPITNDDNLAPGEWRTIDIALSELFAPDTTRRLGQLLIQNINAPGSGAFTTLYLSNVYFWREGSSEGE